MTDVASDHTIRRLGEEGVEIYGVDDGDVLAEIDFDEEAGVPIFGYARENGSHTVFLCPPDMDCIRVLYVSSESEGDMKEMLDEIVDRFGHTELHFFNVINQDLLQKVAGISTKTVQIEEEKVVVGVCEWEA